LSPLREEFSTLTEIFCYLFVERRRTNIKERKTGKHQIFLKRNLAFFVEKERVTYLLSS
jgi:hypothetical protein